MTSEMREKLKGVEKFADKQYRYGKGEEIILKRWMSFMLFVNGPFVTM